MVNIQLSYTNHTFLKITAKLLHQKINSNKIYDMTKNQQQ